MFCNIEFPQYQYNPDQYNLELIRGIDVEERPYDFKREILQRLPSNGTLLDVGCGSAIKLLPLSQDIKKIIGIDKNPSIIIRAKQRIAESGFKNIRVMVGNGSRIPLPDESVDMVTYMLSPHNVLEALRVLKVNGYVVADRVGEQDKSEIKNYFTDETGKPRGYRSSLAKGEVSRTHRQEFETAGFTDVVCRDVYWQTKYTKEGVWQLLNSTPTIEHFNPEADLERFEQACFELAEPDTITLTQHRVLIIARK